jgi:hypothetical protein
MAEPDQTIREIAANESGDAGDREPQARRLATDAALALPSVR